MENIEIIEKIEEFTELTLELSQLIEGLNIKRLKESKDEIHGILEHMIELYDELESSLEEDEQDDDYTII